MRWRFYTTASGAEVVSGELSELGTAARAAVVEAMHRVAKGEARAGETKKLKGELREVRTALDGQSYRLVYATLGQHDQVLLALTTFHKKTQRTPPAVIKRAEDRLRDWQLRSRV